MTMRAVWWLLKLGWRVATRARVTLGLHVPPRLIVLPERPAVVSTSSDPCSGDTPWSLGGQLDTDERPPRANLADWIDGRPDAVVESIREIARAYEKTFCGACGAGPDDPTKRCPMCLVRLERLVARSTNDELGRLRELVQRGVL